MNEILELFKQFENKRNEIEMPLSEMKDILNRFDRGICIYGAGSAGIAFCHYLQRIQVKPLCFIDGNPKKRGTICEGVRVLCIEDIKKERLEESLIIVCINTDGKRYCKSFDDALRVGGHHGVYEKLYGAGCKYIIDYTFFRRCFGFFHKEEFNAPSCSDIDLMMQHKQDIADVYELLDGEFSRDIFLKIVKFRLLDDSLEIPTLSQENQYFESGIYHKRDDAVFFDCGAYRGNSLDTFLRINGTKFERYYGVEPDKVNYNLLRQYVNGLANETAEKCCLEQGAVWDARSTLKLYALDGPGSFISNANHLEKVQAKTIDEMVGGSKVTFIKMNIEGSEKQALRGARETVEKYRPQLAIAGYHRTEDLWEIPLMIKSFNLKYKIDLRSYMNHISFVYYAT
ncbi:methyltransferase, FkbM family [Lachnospiraceae bacterium KHCPX20]|nr:methyltransferase, FkbM family [Lachnospiraceae bacterium KHCPX20]